MITSIQNPKIQWVRRLQAQAKARRQEGLFVVEGVRLVEEAQQSGWQAHWVLYTEELSPRGQALVQRFSQAGCAVEMVSPGVMDAASDTETPQGILAVLAQRQWALDAPLDFLLIPDGVRDPGNLGTILRTAAAAGVQAAWLPPGAVDPFAPKVLRAAMGAHFRLPVSSLDWAQMLERLHPAPPAPPLQVYLADAQAGLPYTKADLRQPLALVVGGEAAGASQQLAAIANQRLHIPMPGGMESLNAAIAAAILLFEVVRQRQN